MARSSVLEPKIKSTRVPVHFNSPEILSFPSKLSEALDVAFHVVFKSNKLMKKSLLKVSVFLVNTP